MRFILGFVAFALLAGCGSAAPDSAERARLEEEFAKSMEDVVLEGSFTVDADEEPSLRTERYEIRGMTKLAGDLWTITARIQYGEHDFTAPVPVKIVWAGDTPVISLTDVEIPGFGTFSARVLFFRDHYAGTWMHGDHGGNQFGRIIR